MKKLLTIFVLFLGLGLTNAQEKKVLTFDETVAYINDKVGANRAYLVEYISSITANQNGEVTFNFSNRSPSKKINLFSLTKEISISEPTAYAPRYLWFHFSGGDYSLLRLGDDNLADLQKLKKAFEHLKSLSKKTKDPFED